MNNREESASFKRKKGKSTDIIGQTTHTHTHTYIVTQRSNKGLALPALNVSMLPRPLVFAGGVLRHVRECPTDSPFFNVTDHK
jgi:hypothetical protein